MARDVVIVSWDGQSCPLEFFCIDDVSDFRLILFSHKLDYSSHAVPSDIELLVCESEGKGDIFAAVIDHLSNGGMMDASPPPFVGFLDDDIEISVSQINQMLRRGRELGASIFAATTTKDSFVSHPRFCARANGSWREEPWIEGMSPFIDWRILLAARPLIQGFISGHGIDEFIFPAVQKVKTGQPAILFDDIQMRHNRPVTSNDKIYRNGLNAQAERDMIHTLTMAWVRAERSDLEGTAWWYRTFASWKGPGRYWPERLTCRLRRLNLFA